MEPERDALAILSLLAVQGVGPAKITKAVAQARERNLSPADLIEAPGELAGVLSADQVRAVGAARVRAASLAAQVEQRGGVLLAVTDRRYPATLSRQLGQSAPPLLTVMGNMSFLDVASVGFCGSRAASEKGLATASDCAEQLAQAGINVVSGYAAGVDMTAHRAALHAGGSTTVVLAEGILQFNVKREIKESWDTRRAAVVSEFLPDSAWSVHNAMRRNRTICGLSRAMVLIEARAAGGSHEAGKACLELGIPLFAAVYEGMPDSAEGNRQLLTEGARQLLKGRASGRANVAPILQSLRADATHAAAALHPAGARS